MARKELEKLNRALSGRSSLDISSVSAVEAKNRLDSEARGLNSELEDSGVEVAEEARGFSFREIIQASGLPEENREVPALMRQMDVVSRVVETVADTEVEELIAVNRPAGIREIRQDAFNVIRLNLQIEGSLEKVRELVNTLHEDPDYYFSVPFFEWESSQAEIPEAPGSQEGEGRSSRRLFRSESRREPREDWEFENQPEEMEREESSQPRERRQIRFDDSVRVAMPVHYIEFKPEENQEN